MTASAAVDGGLHRDAKVEVLRAALVVLRARRPVMQALDASVLWMGAEIPAPAACGSDSWMGTMERW